MLYPEGTWVVDTMTGDLGEVLRQTGGLLSLQRPGRRGLWSADPGSVRPATERELRAEVLTGSFAGAATGTRT
jgi:hypothetical protein